MYTTTKWDKNGWTTKKKQLVLYLIICPVGVFFLYTTFRSFVLSFFQCAPFSVLISRSEVYRAMTNRTHTKKKHADIGKRKSKQRVGKKASNEKAKNQWNKINANDVGKTNLYWASYWSCTKVANHITIQIWFSKQETGIWRWWVHWCRRIYWSAAERMLDIGNQTSNHRRTTVNRNRSRARQCFAKFKWRTMLRCSNPGCSVLAVCLFARCTAMIVSLLSFGLFVQADRLLHSKCRTSVLQIVRETKMYTHTHKLHSTVNVFFAMRILTPNGGPSQIANANVSIAAMRLLTKQKLRSRVSHKCYKTKVTL